MIRCSKEYIVPDGWPLIASGGWHGRVQWLRSDA